MTRLGRPKGLIRYDSENGFEGNKTRLLRPRMALYGALVLIGALVAVVTIRQRTTYAANVLRLSGPPYELVGDQVRNTLEVHIVNKSDVPAHFDFAPSDPPGAAPLTLTFAAPSLDLAPYESRRVPLFVTGPRGAPRPVRFHVRRAGEAEAIELQAQFLGPNSP
jgi:polyferredoxin